MDVHAAVAVERGDAAVLLEPVGVGGDLDEADPLEARREAGLGLEARVEVAGVFAQLSRSFRERAEGDDQTSRVPRRAAGQAVALEQHDVFPACVSEVVGHGAADDTTPHDNHARSLREYRLGHERSPEEYP